MPPLVMKEPQGGLLNQTSNLIILRQVRYGREKRVPWGISEAAFNARDREMTYQYTNFGVPGLGLKRGLAQNTVIAPYATVLAAQFNSFRDPFVILRHSTLIDRFRIGPAQHRQDANVRAEKILQEYHLEFDRVFHRVAIIFRRDRVRRVAGEFVHESGICRRIPEWRAVRFARQAELVRRAVMRRSEHDECTFFVVRAQEPVCRAIRFVSA